MDRSRLLYLIRLYKANAASSSELEELSRYISTTTDDELFTEILLEEMEQEPVSGGDVGAFEGLADKALAASRERQVGTGLRAGRTVPLRRWVWAAASVLLLVLGGVYVMSRKNKETIVAKVEARPVIISPGRNGALLTLADGSVVSLDSVGNGKVASQRGADVFVRDGRLLYAAAGAVAGETFYNVLSTPKGRQYHIQLPDGTDVWLNAASSIRYPTVFHGAGREVDVTGEAYFEIAKDVQHPFKVRLGSSHIDVLGTHFNVNAYGNEPAVATTLLEGSVRVGVDSGAGEVPGEVLKAGQQGRFDPAKRMLSVENDVETASVMAWKNGMFDFTDMGLREVMQQLERWYDIDVRYEKGVSNIRFFGKMTKNIPLADLLTILEKSKVHFRMEGRTLVVVKQ